MAAKVAIKGSDYSTEDLQHDLVETGATALTVGLEIDDANALCGKIRTQRSAALDVLS